jgi:hypothetical protein
MSASLHFDVGDCCCSLFLILYVHCCVTVYSHTSNVHNNSELLRTAMLDVYLGQDAVSPTAKQSFAAGMAKLFR